MRDIVARTSEVRVAPRRRVPKLGLAGRLILLNVAFVMIAEITIYVPGRSPTCASTGCAAISPAR